MIEALIQPAVNLMGLAALTLVLCIVPVMATGMIIRSLWWWGLGDVE